MRDSKALLLSMSLWKTWIVVGLAAGFGLVLSNAQVVPLVARNEEDTVELCGVGKQSSCLIAGEPLECQEDDTCPLFLVLLFPLFAVAIGLLVEILMRDWQKVPSTVIILLLGCAWGAAFCGDDLGFLSRSAQLWIHLEPPEAFFYLFLAPLIFESSFNTDWYVFQKLLGPILTLAFPGVLVQLVIIAALARYVFQAPGWGWPAALMFGAMLSATDPISVTSTLKAVGASETMGTLIEGESLLNDGSAFVLFEGFLANVIEPGSNSAGRIALDVLRLAGGGAAMGIAFGIFAVILLSFVHEKVEIEVSITVVTAFLGFWTAQAPSVLSGVICNVFSGIVLSALGKPLITPSSRGPVRHFWEVLAWIANTFVFFYAGVLIVTFAWTCSQEPLRPVDYVYIVPWYIVLQVIRFGVVFLLQFYNKRFISWKEAIIVSAAGLRGAVSLILAQLVAAESISPEISARAVVWTVGVVFLSLLVNSLAISPLIKLFDLSSKTLIEKEFLWRARGTALQRALELLDDAAVKPSSKLVNWSRLAKAVIPREWLTDHDRAAAAYARGSRADGDDLTGMSHSHHAFGGERKFRRALSKVRPAKLQKSQGRHDRKKEAKLGPQGRQDESRLSLARRLSVELGNIHDLRAEAHHDNTYGDVDIEVRRRVILDLIKYVTDYYDTSLLTFTALTILEGDLKEALDANAEGREYLIFSFLEKPNAFHLAKIKPLKPVLRLLQSRMVSIVESALGLVLKEEYVYTSDPVRKDISELFRSANETRARLATLDEPGMSLVETDALIETIFEKEVEEIQSMLKSGLVSESDFKFISGDLKKLRSNYYLPSLFHKASKHTATGQLELSDSPLFRALTHDELQRVQQECKVERFGAGQHVPLESGDVAVILDGSLNTKLRPCAKQATEVRGNDYHWCFPKYTAFVDGQSFTQNYPWRFNTSDDTRMIACETTGFAVIVVIPKDLCFSLAQMNENFETELARCYGYLLSLTFLADVSATAGSIMLEDEVEAEDDSRSSTGGEVEQSSFHQLKQRMQAMLRRLPYSVPYSLDSGSENVGLKGPAILLQGRLSAGPLGLVPVSTHKAPSLLPSGHFSVSVEGAENVVILGVPFQSTEEVAIQRIARWSGSEVDVNSNGRFMGVLHLGSVK